VGFAKKTGGVGTSPRCQEIARLLHTLSPWFHDFRVGLSRHLMDCIYHLGSTINEHAMLHLRLALLGLGAYLFSLISATALTYKLVANEKACFFTDVKQQGAKIAFYFAVSLL